MDLKNPTNAYRKLSIFDIRLPQGSIFGNPDCARLVIGTRYYVLGTMYSVLGTRYYVLGTMYSVLGTRYYVLGTRY